MPGTILRVSVSAGQAVKPGDTVCILEAMKMKNPIRATGAGTVAEIAVSGGTERNLQPVADQNRVAVPGSYPLAPIFVWAWTHAGRW